MDFSPLITVLEGDFNMEKASTTGVGTLENLDDTKQMSKGKPPRHLSSITSTTTTTSRLQVAVTTLILYDLWICIQMM